MTITRNLLLALMVLTPATLCAQARLTGTVTDSTGAVVAGATVSARYIATGQVVPAQTTQTGTYSVPFLNPGEYETVCELAGFNKLLRFGVVLETGTTT